MQFRRGDVVRSSDPFKLGIDRQRPWLILNTDEHPFAAEQYIAMAISTKEYPPSLELVDEVWEEGGVPERSFVSPWAIHSPRLEDIEIWQGCVVPEFVEQVIEQLDTYIR